MLQTTSASVEPSPLAEVLHIIPRLTQSEKLELIAHLALQTAVTSPAYYWREIAGIAPDLLRGQDAQEWINQIRQEWERE